MANVRPFSAIRPKKGLEDRIAALPYDVYNRAEAKVEVEREPMSFLKIDRAETLFDDAVDTYDECVYEKAKETYLEMKKDGYYVPDNKDCYYLYELTMDGRAQIGIVACASIDDYVNCVIKKHENTRADKEADRIHHVDTLSAQTGPIFLAYKSNEKINSVIAEVTRKEAINDFKSPDDIRHRVWIVDKDEDIITIKEAFENMNAIYIADGHHRCASAVKVGLKRREENPSYTGDEEFNFFLSVLFADEQLMIMDYNRVIKDLNGHSANDVINFLKSKGEIEAVCADSYKPAKKGECGIYFEDTWYRFTFDRALLSDNPVLGLDVSILQREVLEPLFDITDPKTDKRIDFVGGIRGLKELERRVKTDSKIAFAMYPTSIDELFKVADAGLLMPPKSTWFEPKLRSGLFIHEI